jgi:hypothetical protein
MKIYINYKLKYLHIVLVLFFGCKQDTQWEGQKPVEKVCTLTVPIQLQYKGIFDLGNGIYCSNDFNGARLNGVVLTDDTLVTILITPENAPINMSPWYAFQIWSEEKRDISLKLTYDEGAYHRYYPKLSRDGLNWQILDSVKYKETLELINDEEEEEKVPVNATMQLSIGPDTLWVSAQELITSSMIDQWSEHLALKPFISKTRIGESHKGKPLNLLKIGQGEDKKMIMVLSRQHPPEITGFLAMQAFVETICSDSELAVEFRGEYNTYVVPLMNPDGVDYGHWRHNSGGIDLNRDWEDFNQPETIAIREFMKQRTSAGGKFYFGIDFHSTQEDIYYTIDPEFKGNMPGLVPDLITATGNEFADYEPNVQPRTEFGAKVTSYAYFFFEHGAEAFTYEVGDNTPRDFIRKKAEVTAIKLMELMTKQY